MYLNWSPSSSLAFLCLVAVLHFQASEPCTVNVVNNVGGDLSVNAFDGTDFICMVHSSNNLIDNNGGQLTCSGSSCQINLDSNDFCKGAFEVPCNDYAIFYSDENGNVLVCTSSTNTCGGGGRRRLRSRRTAAAAANAAAAGKSMATE